MNRSIQKRKDFWSFTEYSLEYYDGINEQW